MSKRRRCVQRTPKTSTRRNSDPRPKAYSSRRNRAQAVQTHSKHIGSGVANHLRIGYSRGDHDDETLTTKKKYEIPKTKAYDPGLWPSRAYMTRDPKMSAERTQMKSDRGPLRRTSRRVDVYIRHQSTTQFAEKQRKSSCEHIRSSEMNSPRAAGT